MGVCETHWLLRYTWPDPSLLLARPLTSVGQTLHFYQPSQAAPGQTVSGCVGTVPDRAVPSWAVSPCRPDTGTSLFFEPTMTMIASVDLPMSWHSLAGFT